MGVMSSGGMMAGTVTDTNGGFNAAVNADPQWKLSIGGLPLATYDHFKLDNPVTVNTSTGSVSGVTMALPMGTAIVYGHVKDDQGHPLPGVRLWVNDSSNLYSTAALTDQNGNYYESAFALGTNWNVTVDTSIPSSANYTFAISNATVNVTNDQAFRADFVGSINGEPFVSQPTWLAPARFGFTLSGSPGTNYSILACTNLATTNWFTVLTTNLSTSPVSIQDNQATNNQRFYRVKVGQ